MGEEKYKENMVVKYGVSIYIIREILEDTLKMQLTKRNCVIPGVHVYTDVKRFEDEGGEILGIAEWVDTPLGDQ